MRQATIGMTAATVSLIAILASAQNAPSSPRIRGFSAAASAAELARERDFQAMPDAKAAEADFDVMTAEPHHTGSPYEIKLADYVADRFKAFGYDESRDEYGVLLPWPGERRLDIVGPDEMKLQVEEEKIRGDHGPTCRGSCRPTTPTRRPATSPARSST
jgi:N-acetylated-alpha-linked acidic dipeptidase